MTPRFSICNELYFDRSFAKACEHAASLGYQGVEIAPFTLGESVFEISSEQRKQTRDTANRFGLEIVGLHWLLAKTSGLHITHPDKSIRQNTRQYLEALIELTADLGGKIMVFGSPQQRNLGPQTSCEEGIQRSVDLFQALIPKLESLDVQLAIEPLGAEEGNFLTTAEEAIELIKSVGSPQVGLILDIKAMATESKPFADIIHDSQPWLMHFHANDPNRQGPGMGKVDLKPIATALHEIEYDGWISVEVFDYRPGVEALARLSFANLHEAMG